MKMINQELIEFANHLADVSCNIAQKYFRKNFIIDDKVDGTPVTFVDKEIERIIRYEITRKYPDHGIVGEELGNINSSADFKWVIDPIDGTSSFIIGKPVFGTLIALAYLGSPIIGIINQPISDERWVGVIDQGVSFNGKKISSRTTGSIANSVLCTTSPAFFSGIDLSFFSAVSSKTKYQKYGGVFYGGDCYLFGLMAMGCLDIIIETGLKNYDFCALVPIVEEAGGVITDWEGNKLHIDSSGQIIACGDPKVHKEILEIAKSVFV